MPRAPGAAGAWCRRRRLARAPAAAGARCRGRPACCQGCRDAGCSTRCSASFGRGLEQVMGSSDMARPVPGPQMVCKVPIGGRPRGVRVREGARRRPCGFVRCPVPTRWSGAGAQWRVVRCRPCGFARCQLGGRGPVAGCPVPTLRVCPVPGARCQLGRRGPVPSGRVPGPSGECPVPASPVPGGRSGLRRECVYGSGAGLVCAAECRPGASAAWDGLGADLRRGIQTRTASGLMSKRRPRHTG